MCVGVYESGPAFAGSVLANVWIRALPPVWFEK